MDYRRSTSSNKRSSPFLSERHTKSLCANSATEFGSKKNGLRFPSLDLTEEACVGKDGKKFVRAVTKIVYKDYKFLTVETETDFKQS